MSEKETFDEENKCLHHKDIEEQSKLELKPCPFCGGKADYDYDDYGIHAFCTKCDSRTGDFETINEALNSWNFRPIEDIHNNEITCLREALVEIKNTVEFAQDTVYPLHITLDSKDGLYILEVIKEALKGK